ncbi:hypothetical protein [Rhodopseudomonas sp. BR0G17]|uniref:hypothetical protein n=1 Tax=Rhodopseudomonas sp. BR0G17 TaxID=2269368 RepID=UPI0013E01F37|nr:hypothetical protein [Rhodopseudomonas sp. BR0G17]NEW96625.1 hypothetical protein [Rhodopseudomonas sp. BR0G17]
MTRPQFIAMAFGLILAGVAIGYSIGGASRVASVAKLGAAVTAAQVTQCVKRDRMLPAIEVRP